jgi:tetraacyldisaccharide 4'-kinase
LYEDSLGLFSAIYNIALVCRRFSYNHLWKPEKLPAKVISIGNLTLGGTGKTPAVISVAKEAKKRGFNPCILTRGYGGKTKDICFVSKGDKPLLDAYQAGDEVFLMAQILKDIPIVKGKKRYEAGMFAFRGLTPIGLQPSLFILDDGFQHWKLQRDVDVLLIDATNPFGNGKLFPEGILREPFNAIKRAHIIIITKADTVSHKSIAEISQKIKKYNTTAPIFTASHRAIELIDLYGGVKDIDMLNNKKIYAFAGIANPDYFRLTLKKAGAEIVKFRKFRDHHVYKQKEIDEIIKNAAGLDIIITEKDMVKLKRLKVSDNVYALRIEFSIDNDFYNNLFGRLQ